MKKIVLFFAITIALGTTLHAQQNTNMQQAWKSYLKDSVKVADPMIDSFMAIRTQYQPQMRQIFMDQSSSMDDKKTKMQGLRTEMETRYKSAGFTSEQIQKIHAHEDEMRAQMMSRRNGGGSGQ